MIDKTINSGTDAQNGFSLQRNTAIFLLLENYFNKFQNKKYFICLEHHDDFLFCFLNENDEVDLIEAYQSKKKSPDIWRLNPELYGILSKLLKTGQELIKDEISKSSEYKHRLFFSSNQTINLTDSESISIKVDNELVEYNNLPVSIQHRIKNQISDTNLHNELEKLNFIWISLTSKFKEQKNHLAGKVKDVFKDKIFDGKAAVDTLILLFLDIENTYNQGNIVKLLDKTKRVSNSEVENAFKILTTKSKCFDYWRDKKGEVSSKLKIRIQDRETFEFVFESAFDLFKSIKEAEHQKIFKFVKDQINNKDFYTEDEAVNEIFELFNQYKNIETRKFDDLQLKAILFAALFEVLYLKEN
ncbi:hypothetical protein [Chryseobacterium balustinum]|uniref:hypothetical protein n=1 Tax=Chryseobacterium balustinum TaxID=246 RepID=UPI003CF1F141